MNETVVKLKTAEVKESSRELRHPPAPYQPDIRPLDLTAFRGNCIALRAVLFALIDSLAIMLAFYAAYEVADLIRWFGLGVSQPVDRINVLNASLVAIVPLTMIVGLCAYWEHYNRRLTFWSELRDVYKAIIYSAALLSIVLFAIKEDFSRFWVVSFLLLLAAFVPVGRLLTRKLLSIIGVWKKPVVVIGDGPAAFAQANLACEDPYMGLHIVNYVDIADKIRLQNLATRLRYGAEVANDGFGAERERPHVVVAVENLDNLKRSKDAFDAVMGACAAITFIPPISGIPLYNSQLLQTFRGDNVVLRLHNNLKRRSAKAVKRAIDIGVCSLALIVASPIMLVVGLLVKMDGGPMLYGQTRIGQGGRKFKCLKFRSMDINADEKLRQLLDTDEEARQSWEKDHKLKNDPRITWIGNFIRKTSLDELPQFWNVLKGEMSLIGPRPIVEAEIGRYGADFGYYAEAKPGITGLWQISGRNDTSYGERVALDVWYVKNWSPWLDMVIALKTVPIILFGVGAY